MADSKISEPNELDRSERKKRRKGAKVKCSFFGCLNSKYRCPSMHFFTFPVKRPAICKQWVRNSGNKKLLNIVDTSLYLRKVCEVHFTENCFTKSTENVIRKRVHVWAVPTLPAVGYDLTSLQTSMDDAVVNQAEERQLKSTSPAAEEEERASTKSAGKETSEEKTPEKSKPSKKTSNKNTSKKLLAVVKRIKISKEELLAYIKSFPETFANFSALQANEKGETTNTSSENIKNKVLSLRFPKAAAILDYKACRSTIYRCRQMGSNSSTDLDVEVKDIVESMVDSNVSSQLDFNAMSSALAKIRKSTDSTAKEKPQIPAEPQSIESQPCSSNSKIQFDPMELVSRNDSGFGQLEECNMLNYSGKQNASKEKKKQREIEPSVSGKQKELETSVQENLKETKTSEKLKEAETSAQEELKEIEISAQKKQRKTEISEQDKEEQTETSTQDGTSADKVQSSPTKLDKGADSLPVIGGSNLTQLKVTESASDSLPSVNEDSTVIHSAADKPVTSSLYIPIKDTNTNAQTKYKNTKQVAPTSHYKLIKCDKIEVSAKRLEATINKLENLSNRFMTASLVDSYDHFGKYISSLLRGLPDTTVNSLKKKITSDVMEALCEDRYKTQKSVGIQVSPEPTTTDQSSALTKSVGTEALPVYRHVYTRCVSKGVNTETLPSPSNVPLKRAVKKCVPSKEKLPLAGNIPVKKGNLPVVFSSASTSTSYKIVPVMAVSCPSRGRTATVVTSHSFGSPITSVQPSIVSSISPVQSQMLDSISSVQPISLSQCETVTTVKSADGTIFAVTIPKSHVDDTTIGTDYSYGGPSFKQSMPKPSGAKKRKQSFENYLIKIPQKENNLQSQKNSTDSGGRVICRCESQDVVNEAAILTDYKCIRSDHKSPESPTGIPKISSAGVVYNILHKENGLHLMPHNSKRGDVSSCGSQDGPQTCPRTEDLQLQHNFEDSGGGDMPRFGFQDGNGDAQEFEMDIEEGHENVRIKEDHDFYDESEIEIKEEVLDLDEISECDFTDSQLNPLSLTPPPLPPAAERPGLASPAKDTSSN